MGRWVLDARVVASGGGSEALGEEFVLLALVVKVLDGRVVLSVLFDQALVLSLEVRGLCSGFCQSLLLGRERLCKARVDVLNIT